MRAGIMPRSRRAPVVCACIDIGSNTTRLLVAEYAGGDLRELAEERGETVIVVAHQPDCSRIAAELTGGQEPAFPPGAMLAIDLP